MSGNDGTPSTLLLRANGTAELLDAGQSTLWSSDSDEDFVEQWAGTLFLNESDVPELLNYLIDVGELTARQADRLAIEEEAFSEDDDGGEADASDVTE